MTNKSQNTVIKMEEKQNFFFSSPFSLIYYKIFNILLQSNKLSTDVSDHFWMV